MRYGAIIATALITAGVVAAAFIAFTAGPAGSPAASPPPSTPAVPLVTVTGPDGRPVRVPATLPPDCRRAYALMAPALLPAREALKAILKGDRGRLALASLERANASLRGPTLGGDITAALLDCGSQDIRTATAYREAREAVTSASISAALVAHRRLTPTAITVLERELAVIESALARL